MVASGLMPARAKEDWPAEKCRRYRKATSDALHRLGRDGLSPQFLARHDKFLTENCQVAVAVCPKSPEEFRFANTLVILGMNAGMASTFFPFSCAHQ